MVTKQPIRSLETTSVTNSPGAKEIEAKDVGKFWGHMVIQSEFEPMDSKQLDAKSRYS